MLHIYTGYWKKQLYILLHTAVFMQLYYKLLPLVCKLHNVYMGNFLTGCWLDFRHFNAIFLRWTLTSGQCRTCVAVGGMVKTSISTVWSNSITTVGPVESSWPMSVLLRLKPTQVHTSYLVPSMGTIISVVTLQDANLLHKS